MADGTRDAEWMLTALDIAEAHKITTGEGVVVGLLDTGVDTTHPDLTGVVIGGKDSWSPKRDGQTDATGHGTAMASLIAGHGHGEGGRDGVLGVAPGAKILSYGALKPGQDRYDFEENANGLEWLIDNGANVIVIAQSGGSSYPREEALIKEAVDRGIIVVAGVGNRAPFGNGAGFPGAYDDVLSISGTNPSGGLCEPSVRGEPTVDFAAPCEDVTVAAPGGGYVTDSGTSMSTAIAGGVVALIKWQWPDMSKPDVYRQLAFTADDLGVQGKDADFGYGLINPVRALTQEPQANSSAHPPHRRDDPIYASASPASSQVAEAGGGSIFWLLWGIVGIVGMIGLSAVAIAIMRGRRSRATAV